LDNSSLSSKPPAPDPPATNAGADDSRAIVLIPETSAATTTTTIVPATVNDGGDAIMGNEGRHLKHGFVDTFLIGDDTEYQPAFSTLLSPPPLIGHLCALPDSLPSSPVLSYSFDDDDDI
jgi:hypothetical protein